MQKLVNAPTGIISCSEPVTMPVEVKLPADILFSQILYKIIRIEIRCKVTIRQDFLISYLIIDIIRNIYFNFFAIV